jgi:hypothetical protein
VDRKKNFTLSLPAPLLDKLRVYAAKRQASITAVINEAIQEKVGQDESEREARTRRAIGRMKNAPNLGTGGVRDWKREDLYDRIR